MPEGTQAAIGMASHDPDNGAADAVRPFPSRRRMRVPTLRFRSRLLLAVADMSIVGVAYGFARLLDPGLPGSRSDGHDFLWFLVFAVVAHQFMHHIFNLHGRMWRHAGIREARDVLLAETMSASVLVGLHLVRPIAPVARVPLAVILSGAVLVTVGVGVFLFRSRLGVPYRRPETPGVRVAIIGSRDAGASAVRDMLNNPGAGLVPVAVFDDDDRAHGMSLQGVPVVGPVDAIPSARKRFGFDQVLLAISSPSSTVMHESLLAAEAAGVTMKLLPGIWDIVAGGQSRSVRRPHRFRIEDLLGREQIATDLDAVRHSLAARRILITGAGGSIGSEIARQVDRFHPECITLLDRDETHLHDAASCLTGAHEQVLVDIRDSDAVFDVFDRHRPSVVFHAAAHKHVPILESHTIEAALTNVFGTLNVVEAAAAHDTPHFVMISTDKAVRPTSVMGATKLIGERILLAKQGTATTFCAVRFGNVLGSRGSVIPTFSRQIAAGGPVTVTDPLMTRFFMTIEEAVQLVLQASQLATGGDIFMLDMGEPVSILDLAQRMIRLSGYGVGTEIDIEFVGGRAGERLSEELCAPDEDRMPTSHPSILRLVPPAIHHDLLAKGLLTLQEKVGMRDAARVRDGLFDLAGPVPDLVDMTPSQMAV